MDDEDALPQDLSYRSQSHNLLFNTQYNTKMNGHNIQNNCNSFTYSSNNVNDFYQSTAMVAATAAAPSSVINGNANTMLKGLLLEQNKPIDLATDRQPMLQDLDTIPLPQQQQQQQQQLTDLSSNNINNVDHLINLKRKYSEYRNDKVIIDSNLSTSPKHMKFFRPFNVNNDHDDVNCSQMQQRQNLATTNETSSSLLLPSSSSPSIKTATTTTTTNTTQQQNHIYQSPTQPPEPPPPPVNMDSILNPAMYNKNVDENMKLFLKQQLQYSDVGKLFGNVNLSTSGTDELIGCGQFLGLQPSVKFKCFKCDKSTFLSLAELKDHQVMCLKVMDQMACQSPSSTPTSSSQQIQSTQSSEETKNNNNNNNNNNNSSNSTEVCDKQHNSIINDNVTTNTTTTTTTIITPTKQIDTKIRITRKVFLCSACGTYYENWNLFHHMREVHNKFICLHCLGIFPSADRLVHHLEVKHTSKPNIYEHKEQLLAAIHDQCYLMCCVCEHIFSEQDNFTSHSCENYIQPCAQCGLKFIHRPTCQLSTIQQMSRKSSKHKERDKLRGGHNRSDLLNGNGKNKKEKKSKKSISSTAATTTTTTTSSSSNICDWNRVLPTPLMDTTTTIGLLHNGIENIENYNLHGSTLELESINLLQPHNTKYQPPLPAANAPFHPFGHQKNHLSTSMNSNQYPNYYPMAPTNALTTYPPNPLTTTNFNTLFNHEPQPKLETSHKLAQNVDPQNQHEDYLDARDIDILNNIFDKMQNDISELGGVTVDGRIQDDDDNNHDNDINKTNTIKNGLSSDTMHHHNNHNQQHHHHYHHTNNMDGRKIEIVDRIETETEADSSPEKPLLVPKLKLKISKQFQAPIESEESSTESDDELYVDESINSNDDDDDDNDNDEEVEEDAEEEEEEEEEVENDANEADDDEENKVDTVDNAVVQNENDDNKNDDPIDLGENITEPIENDENESLKIELTPQLDQINEPEERKAEEEDDEEDEEETDVKDEENPNAIDNIIPAGDEVYTLELQLKQPLDKIEIEQFLRICLTAAYPICLYCNHARQIAVNGKSLSIHFITHHKFSATVDSITAEELHPPTIVQRIKSSMNELDDVYFNLSTYDSREKNQNAQYEKMYECFQCRFQSRIHKELYLHNRKMHLKSILMCIMCKANFYSYSELICHICPGSNQKLIIFDLKFRCVLCDMDQIPSAFRLMVHLRKKHSACDVCLEECFDQSKLSSHVWKHKLHHLCYRCNITYRNKQDITRHLFWKHGTESVVCKKCLQKKWPHVYHFCIPPPLFQCETCNLSFSRALALKVHKRLHSGEDAPYACTEDGCDKRLISRKLLLKHVQRHSMPPEPPEPIPIVSTVKVEMPELKQNNVEDNEANEKQRKGGMNKIDSKKSDKMNNKIVEKTKKVKKSKESKDKKIENDPNMIDIINMPAPNLSESDSSDESDMEKSTNRPQPLRLPSPSSSPPPPPTTTTMQQTPVDDLSSLNSSFSSLNGISHSDAGTIADDSVGVVVADDDDTNKPIPIANIWDNFKSYQASQFQDKIDNNDVDESAEPLPPPIIHVVQSDHDYSLMYKILTKPIANETDKIDEMNLTEITETLLNNSSGAKQPQLIPPSSRQTQKQQTLKQQKQTKTSPKKGRSPKKGLPKSESDSSSDGNSSDSSSSCSCGSNCSCSTSSGGSSSSSSSSSSTDDSDDSDGPTLEKQKKKTPKKEKRIRLKSEASSKANLSDNIDVVGTDVKQTIPVTAATTTTILRDPDTIIFESDLETNESETDEDFYDDNPQKLANQILAEKRKQLMLQTCANSSVVNSLDVVVDHNSRTSTPPSLPVTDGLIKEKRIKAKKRKKDRKNSSKSIPPLKINIPLNKISQFDFNPSCTNIVQAHPLCVQSPQQQQQQQQSALFPQPPLPPTPSSSSSSVFASHFPNESLRLKLNTSLPATLQTAKPRLSTGSNCSDIETPLKRSKRRRIPNKFYGYTSDEDDRFNAHGNSSNSLTMNAFKPQPPPNLTWCKEDLPQTPTIIRTPPIKTVIKLSSASKAKSTPVSPRRMKNTSPAASTPMIVTTKIPSSASPPYHYQQQQQQQPQPLLVPPIIIRPNRITTTTVAPPPTPQPPTIIEPRVPSVPVHHIIPPSDLPEPDSEPSDDSSSSDSSDEGILQISQPIANAAAAASAVASAPILDGNNQIQTQLTSGGNYNQLAPPPPTSQSQFYVNNQNNQKQQYPFAMPSIQSDQIRYPIMPPAGCRPAREGESVYCYCRCPYDEVSEMIACDGANCPIEWFHFECVNIMVPPKGTWYCPQCRPKYININEQQQHFQDIT